MKKTAVIIADMLNDFVTGSLACERAQRIVSPLAKLVAFSRAHDIPVIYTNDAHLPELDHELELWGEHAMANTPGAQVIPELAPADKDFVVPKRRYSGFFETGLQLILTELGVERVVLCGLQAHICVQHTAADAFQWGYEIIIPTNGVDAFTEEDYQTSLSYMKEMYGAQLMSVDELIAEL